MKKAEYIESIYNRCLKKHQQELVSQFLSSIKNEHEKFKPYNSNPKHYIISIYDPLQLHYVLLGATNLGVSIEFNDENKIDNELVTRFGLNKDDPDSIYNSEVIQLKREIEYYFLQKVLIEIQKELGYEIQLYITQHITEVSYDISNMKSIDSEYLWENLEN